MKKKVHYSLKLTVILTFENSKEGKVLFIIYLLSIIYSYILIDINFNEKCLKILY